VFASTVPVAAWSAAARCAHAWCTVAVVEVVGAAALGDVVQRRPALALAHRPLVHRVVEVRVERGRAVEARALVPGVEERALDDDRGERRVPQLGHRLLGQNVVAVAEELLQRVLVSSPKCGKDVALGGEIADHLEPPVADGTVHLGSSMAPPP
jgi:hypothetical protein